MNNWCKITNSQIPCWVKKVRNKILEIQQLEDDFIVFDVSKGRFSIGTKTKLAAAKSLGNMYLHQTKVKVK